MKNNSKEKRIRKINWKKFNSQHSNLIHKSGLPLSYFENENLWIDFLMHGYMDHHDDIIGLTVSNLNSEEYNNFKMLIYKYFGFGFDFFVPMALKTSKEQKELEETLIKL